MAEERPAALSAVEFQAEQEDGPVPDWGCPASDVDCLDQALGCSLGRSFGVTTPNSSTCDVFPASKRGRLEEVSSAGFQNHARIIRCSRLRTAVSNSAS